MPDCIICAMPGATSPEFSLERPLPSTLAVIRAVLLTPRSFYANFSAEGPLREPIIFVLLVSAVTGALAAVVALVSNLVFGQLGAVLVTLLEALAFALLSPLAVGVVAGVYLLSINTFVGKVANFREVYRMAAYAWSAMVLAWIPVVGAFAVTYALMVLMGIGVRFVYRTSLLTAVVTALVAFVPLGMALIWLRVATAGLTAA
ncbi:MAG TPA: YIP1 family protein [Rubrobacteraceae bacterium]|nr:YIP1 family protein [Rubrobacteraceae bacterium]